MRSPARSPPVETPLFSTFLIRLSRACLDKLMVVFHQKMGPIKRCFLTTAFITAL